MKSIILHLASFFATLILRVGAVPINYDWDGGWFQIIEGGDKPGALPYNPYGPMMIRRPKNSLSPGSLLPWEKWPADDYPFRVRRALTAKNAPTTASTPTSSSLPKIGPRAPYIPTFVLEHAFAIWDDIVLRATKRLPDDPRGFPLLDIYGCTFDGHHGLKDDKILCPAGGRDGEQTLPKRGLTKEEIAEHIGDGVVKPVKADPDLVGAVLVGKRSETEKDTIYDSKSALVIEDLPKIRVMASGDKVARKDELLSTGFGNRIAAGAAIATATISAFHIGNQSEKIEEVPIKKRSRTLLEELIVMASGGDVRLPQKENYLQKRSTNMFEFICIFSNWVILETGGGKKDSPNNWNLGGNNSIGITKRSRYSFAKALWENRRMKASDPETDKPLEDEKDKDAANQSLTNDTSEHRRGASMGIIEGFKAAEVDSH